MIRKILLTVVVALLSVYNCHAATITEAIIFVELYYARIDSLACEFLKTKERNDRTFELCESLRSMIDEDASVPNDWLYFGEFGSDGKTHVSKRLMATSYTFWLMHCLEQFCKEQTDAERVCQAQVTRAELVDSTFFNVGVKKAISLGVKTVVFQETVTLHIEDDIFKITEIRGGAISGSDLKRIDDIRSFSPNEREQFFGGLMQRINEIKSNLQLLGREDLNTTVKEGIVRQLLEEFPDSATINNQKAKKYLEKLSKGEVPPVNEKEIMKVSVCFPTGFVSTPNGKYLVWGDKYTYDFATEGDLPYSLSQDGVEIEIHDVATPPLRSIPQPDGTFMRRLKAFVTGIEM